MLLAYREDPSFFAVSLSLGVPHQTVQHCVERALASRPMAALHDRPRQGKEPTIATEAKAWVVWLAKAKSPWAIRSRVCRRNPLATGRNPSFNPASGLRPVGLPT